MLWNVIFKFLLFWIIYEMLSVLMKIIFWLCDSKSKFLFVIQINKEYKMFFKIKLLSEHKSWILILMTVFSFITRKTIIKSAKIILILIRKKISIVFINVFWADILIIDRLWDIQKWWTWIWTWKNINQKHFLAEKSDRWSKIINHVCLIQNNMLCSTHVLISFVFNLTSELYLTFWRISWIFKKIFW